MNRRQKIIVSVTGIFLVLLVIVGLTYAYFLTKINGNTNTKSISIITKNLSLVYGDGNETITGTNILPGTSLDEKTFTVTNNGGDTVNYVVIIDNTSVINVSTNKETEFVSNDFTYTLTCSSDSGSCNGVDIKTTFPIDGGILVSNSIAKDETQTYSLKVTYEETGVDQSNDMNKQLNARVNIADSNSYNPYANDTSLLAYNIINNAIGLTSEERTNGYAELLVTPKTKVSEEISAEDESVLSITADDYGMSYYYRGNVKNNYVNLNDMCWKIIRIEGDGSIKLVLEDYTNTCENPGHSSNGFYYYGYITHPNYSNFGYTFTNNKYIADYTSETGSIATINSFLNNTLVNNNNTIGLSEATRNLLKEDEWCIGDRTNAYDYETGELLSTDVSTSILNGTKFYYDAGKRLYGIGQERTATLKCNGDVMTSKIGALTADEIVFAGSRLTAEGEGNINFYLYSPYFIDLYYNLSLISFNGTSDMIVSIFDVGSTVAPTAINYYPGPDIRPSITLKTGVEITSGNGTMSNPYEI